MDERRERVGGGSSLASGGQPRQHGVAKLLREGGLDQSRKQLLQLRARRHGEAQLDAGDAQGRAARRRVEGALEDGEQLGLPRVAKLPAHRERVVGARRAQLPALPPDAVR
ncbi:MAG: hypothetical protein AVDCRST_MAG68-1919 [uncultured Gemmatimonadetes bacterium]|uniref:Uncharacterized protein n=1 Tax=uncultured Gemmatimonadota bacterium TaxID=203437 RepID=A0A6J4L1D5_9BACT|nr:MAG: hypothetical protein AVDCRST_MAG68-1919 [uncultured Gemmatimonadota bacterium]